MTWLVVLLRVVANPFSNVFQKVLTQRGADPLFVILATHALLALVCLPLAATHGHGLPREFWLNIMLCAVLAVAGNALIVQALKLSDLSVLGPINAYKPVVSLIPGVILLKEIPSVAGMGGIILIVAGSYWLADRDSSSRRGALGGLFRDRGVQYRLGGLVLSAIEAVFLKKALLASSPLIAFVFWAIFGFGIALIATALQEGIRGGVTRRQSGRDVVAIRSSPREYLLLCLTTGVMQYCTLVSFAALHVGYALALFQTSAILSVLLGHRVFQERHFFQRLAGSAVMAAGSALIIWRS